jgi:hypothetical protein
VADISGRALGAAVDPAVHDDAGADAGAYLHEDEIVRVRRDSAVPLSQGHDVHVIVQKDRAGEAFRQKGGHRVAVPAGHDRRIHRNSAREIDRPRYAEADAEKVLAV